MIVDEIIEQDKRHRCLLFIVFPPHFRKLNDQIKEVKNSRNQNKNEWYLWEPFKEVLVVTLPSSIIMASS